MNPGSCRHRNIRTRSVSRRRIAGMFILGLVLMLATGAARADRAQYTIDTDPLRQGNKAFAAGDLAGAEVFFKAAVANNYHLPEALWGLARLDLSRGSYPEAEARCRQALAAAGGQYAPAQAGLGIALLRQGRAADAQHAFTLALEQDPKLWEAHYGMAMGLMDAGNWQDARKQLEQGRKQHGLVEGEDLYQHGLALLLQGTGDLTGAEAAALKARHLAPLNPTYAYLVARVYRLEGIPALAIPAYEEALAIGNQPPNAERLVELGQLFEQQQRYNEAMDRYLQAVAADSTYAPALADLADLFGRAKQYDKAAGTYLRLVALKPDDSKAQLGLADALFQLGRTNESLAASRAALARTPDDQAAKFAFARAGLHADDDSTRAQAAALVAELPRDLPWSAADLVDLAAWQNDHGEFAAADSTLAHAATLDPQSSRVPFQQGLFELGRGQPRAAVTAFALATKLAPDNAANHLNLGIARFQAGDIDSAVVDFRRAVALRGDLTVARLLLAQGLAMTGSLVEAEKEYRAVLDSEPHNPKALRGVGFCSLRRADYADAVKFYKDATVAEPGNADGWAGLGTSRLGLGQLDTAEKDFVKARAIDPHNSMLKTGSDLLTQAKNNGKEN